MKDVKEEDVNEIAFGLCILSFFYLFIGLFIFVVVGV
jgi:hypothetical protein